MIRVAKDHRSETTIATSKTRIFRHAYGDGSYLDAPKRQKVSQAQILNQYFSDADQRLGKVPAAIDPPIDPIALLTL